MKTLPALLVIVLLAGAAALGQSAGPQPAPAPTPIPVPQDRPYPGVLHVAVDGTDTAHAVFTAHETVPVAAPGPLVLLYPKWIPGDHTPDGPVQELAGLVIHANGQRVAWRRDPVDMFAFHVDVPEGASALDLDFQWLTPVNARVGAVVMTPEMFDLSWNAVVLYPAGYFSRDITVESSLRLPEGWQLGTALPITSHAGPVTSFAPVTLNTLVDSPVYAGHYFKRVDLDPGGTTPIFMNLVGDAADELELTPEALTAHRALVQQAYRLYGSHHYDHYDFLVSVSDDMPGNGLEHHQSSEDGFDGSYFTDWAQSIHDRDLLPHEFTHSWNGKFRRPADLWTPNFDVPMRDSLLWVYEGQTQYWGFVLAARSGLWTKAEALDAIADVAATYDARIARTWRQLEDTTNDPIIANRRPQSWRTWQRSEDYYSEGQLMWFDADTLIREQTQGAKSLDDFARAFFGVDSGSVVTETYTFEDVVKALNSVLPYDWAGFLTTRLQSHGPGAPLDGLTRGGYHLVYTDKPTAFARATDLTYAIGATVGADGVLSGVLWEGPLFKAGLTDGVKLIAVNGMAYSTDRLTAAITAAKGTTTALEFVVQNGDHIRSVTVDYHDGLRYPHLERQAGVPDRLADILAPRKSP